MSPSWITTGQVTDQLALCFDEPHKTAPSNFVHPDVSFSSLALFIGYQLLIP